MGCDAENISKKEDMEFLLTHPVWDVTSRLPLLRQRLLISTHTSRVGCDSAGIPLGSPGYIFLLTHPVWDVTKFQNFLDRIAYNFYSHIPCGMWLALPNLHNLLLHFYSHIPCGMWLAVYFVVAPIFNFYSHIPCGMWRLFPAIYRYQRKISTHTSRVGCDR